MLKTQNEHVDDFAFSIKITRWWLNFSFFSELMWYYINPKIDHLFKNNWMINPHDWPAFYPLIVTVIFRVEASGHLGASEHWRTISLSYILSFPSSWVRGIVNGFGSSNYYLMFWLCVRACVRARVYVSNLLSLPFPLFLFISLLFLLSYSSSLLPFSIVKLKLSSRLPPSYWPTVINGDFYPLET